MVLVSALKSAFDDAVKEGDVHGVMTYIKNPDILAYLASQYSSTELSSLSIASRMGHTQIVKLLLDIEDVKTNDAALPYLIQALTLASENGHTEIVELLLAVKNIKTNAAAWDNDSLRRASTNGHLEVVRLLLTVPSVVSAINDEDHDALTNALDREYWDIVLLLVQHYGSNAIPHFLIAAALRVPDGDPASEEIKDTVLNRVMTVSGEYDPYSDEAQAIDAWIDFWEFSNWPENTDINTISWCNYLYAQTMDCVDPKQAAILLLTLNAMADNHARHLASQNAAGGNESAMESSLVGMVAKHYAEQIEPAYAEKFKLLGDIEDIEQHIKSAILNKIIDNSAESLKEEILLRKNGILNGVDADIIWARSQFRATDDIFQTAWRAYDAGAETVGWKNLLTAPAKENAEEMVFSIVETGSSGENLQSASNTIRKMAAYYYLVTIDERLTQKERETALVSFINAIAEIRRAHNDDASGTDNPSCFPGCITRLHQVTKCNPYITNIKPGFLPALKEIYINELQRALTTELIASDKTQAYCLMDALSKLTMDTAWDVISNPHRIHCLSLMDENEDSYSSALLEVRQAFIAKYLPIEDLYERFKTELNKTYELAMNDDDLVILQALLADVGGHQAAPYIASTCQKRIQTLDSSHQKVSTLMRMSQNAQQSNDTPTISKTLKPE